MTKSYKIMGMYIISCWIEHSVRSLDQTFSYLSNTMIAQGCRVIVPFGVRKIIGFTENCEYTKETQSEIEQRLGLKLKFIDSIVDENPLINEELHDLAFWMKETTLSTTISCFQAMLPSSIKPHGKIKKVVLEKWVRISNHEVSLTPKQVEAYTYLQEHSEVLYSEMREKFKSIPHTLVEKKAFEIFEKEREGDVVIRKQSSEPLPLTKYQQNAFQEIENSNDEVFLLYGVTGSGKTEVYLQLASKYLASGKQVLILVPEISLTPQMIERVSSRFPNTLAIYHSGLSAQEKYEQWKLVREGKARIVVGTRSAVFLPFQNLGLIVMDEEHDGSYKQDVQPCYHARDIAIHRGKFHHCKVILGSATPSLDSYARGLKNVYHLVKMDERVNGVLPDVHVVEMKKAMKNGESFILSDFLKQKIQERLDEGKQVILLLNRRGFHSQLRCRACQEVIRCPHCDLAMSYHKEIHKMKCHTCGAEIFVPKICPHCGSRDGFTSFGYGTEKLEDEVASTFPNARILRMDADTTTKKNSHEQILKSFGNHDADILLGTQMIAKGLDFSDVTLVGIINGDEGLNRTDFRSAETTFDLLMQASGRSGRADKTGEVVIQVMDTEHFVIDAAIHQNYIAFFEHEMQFRRAGQYPPYTYLISVTIQGRNREKVDRTALQFRNEICGNFKVIGIISLLKIRDLYRERILLKGKNLKDMQHAVANLLESGKLDRDLIKVDVNPLVLD